MTETQTRHITDLPHFDPSAEPASIIDALGFEMVHVLVNLRDPGPSRCEALWATPVQVEDDGYGIYVLRNNGLLCPFRTGDLVEAVRGGDSHLRVIGVADLSEGPVTDVAVPEGTPTGVVQEVMETWYTEGAQFTSDLPGILLTSWPEEMSADDVLAILERTAPPAWTVGDIPTTTGRALLLINAVDFGADPATPAGDQ